MRPLSYSIQLAAFLATMLIVVGARAEPESDTIKRAQLTIRKLQQEKSALAAEVAKLTATVAELQGAATKSQKQLGSLRKSQSSTTEKLEEAQAQQKELGAKHEELEHVLRAAKGENERLTGIEAEQKQSLEVCAQKNAKLSEFGAELIREYHDKGFWDVLLQREPVTGLREVEMENRMQAHRDTLDAQRFPPAGATAAPPTTK